MIREKLNLLTRIELEKIRSILLFILLTCYVIYFFILLGFFLKVIVPAANTGFLFTRIYTSGETEVSDFVSFYGAGLLNKERSTKYPSIDVYDPFLLTQSVERVIAPLRPTEIYSIQYPPTFFVLFTPLAWLNLCNAWKTLTLISFTCIAGAFFCLTYRLLKTRKTLIWGLFPCFVSVPIMHHFISGQTTAVEVAIIAAGLSLMRNKKYFYAGIIGALSLFKLQFSPIILIPGIVVGRISFLYGCALMGLAEIIVSIYTVGFNNALNFLRTNYYCEIVHKYTGLNEYWLTINMRGLLTDLPWSIPHISEIATVAYLFTLIITFLLWFKVYPVLEKKIDHAFELIASLSIIPLVFFSLHAYQYDYTLLMISCLWLYLWSSSNIHNNNKTIRLLSCTISLLVTFLPIATWLNLFSPWSAGPPLALNLMSLFIILALILLLSAMVVMIELREYTTLSPALE